MKPYIGITGFTKPEEVAFALNIFPKDGNRKLMVGVLATYKSLRGIPMKPRWAKQTPNPEAIEKIFPDDERVINLVHFSSEVGQNPSILNDLLKIHELAGPNFHGFQLNLVWPEIQVLKEYKRKVGFGYQIILQIGQKSIEVVGATPEGVVEKLSYYVDVIDGILFDLSGGLGKQLDTELAREFLFVIKARGWNLGLGVAGGLGPQSLPLVKPLLSDFPDLSIDAQSQLRNAENDLDTELVKAYLQQALQMF
jgi:hypothetical protein